MFAEPTVSTNVLGKVGAANLSTNTCSNFVEEVGMASSETSTLGNYGIGISQKVCLFESR